MRNVWGYRIVYIGWNIADAKWIVRLVLALCLVKAHHKVVRQGTRLLRNGLHIVFAHCLPWIISCSWLKLDGSIVESIGSIRIALVVEFWGVFVLECTFQKLKSLVDFTLVHSKATGGSWALAHVLLFDLENLVWILDKICLWALGIHVVMVTGEYQRWLLDTHKSALLLASRVKLRTVLLSQSSLPHFVGLNVPWLAEVSRWSIPISLLLAVVFLVSGWEWLWISLWVQSWADCWGNFTYQNVAWVPLWINSDVGSRPIGKIWPWENSGLSGDILSVFHDCSSARRCRVQVTKLNCFLSDYPSLVVVQALLLLETTVQAPLFAARQVGRHLFAIWELLVSFFRAPSFSRVLIRRIIVTANRMQRIPSICRRVYGVAWWRCFIILLERRQPHLNLLLILAKFVVYLGIALDLRFQSPAEVIHIGRLLILWHFFPPLRARLRLLWQVWKLRIVPLVRNFLQMVLLLRSRATDLHEWVALLNRLVTGVIDCAHRILFPVTLLHQIIFKLGPLRSTYIRCFLSYRLYFLRGLQLVPLDEAVWNLLGLIVLDPLLLEPHLKFHTFRLGLLLGLWVRMLLSWR